MPASPLRRARCNRHEARAGIAAIISCCLVRLCNGGLGPPGETISLPACTHQSNCRGAAVSSRLDLLTFSGDKRRAAKHCFSLCSTEHPCQVQNLSGSHATQRMELAKQPPSSRPQKILSPLASVSPRVLQLYGYSIGFRMWRTTFTILRTPTRLMTTPHSLL